jgi:hypothetical protein
VGYIEFLRGKTAKVNLSPVFFERNMAKFVFYFMFILTIAGGCLMSALPSNANEEKGVIGESMENGLSVIYKFVNEMPPQAIRDNFSWLTVISWSYDGSSRNGMPQTEENQKMLNLEDVIEANIVNRNLARHAYSRTGNNRKELVYYIPSREEFMAAFNKEMSGQPHYPIEINFYEDKSWKDFQKILDLFKK